MRRTLFATFCLSFVLSAPVDGQVVIPPVENYQVTGRRFAQQVPQLGRHLGEDVLAGIGTPVRAIADGTIVLSKTHRQGYGQYIVITHMSPVPFVSVYGHLSRQPQYPLRATGSVQKGEIIGYVGSKDENGGWAPHLHVGIYKVAYAGSYRYWGYAPNPTGDDVDFDLQHNPVGGLFTKPSDFLAAFPSPTPTPTPSPGGQAGALDLSFDPGTGLRFGPIGGPASPLGGSGLALAIQSDGRILIGGFFQTYNGVGRNNIVRITGEGSLDGSFNPGTGPNSTVMAVALQGDGKILIGGLFSAYNGIARNGIARLNSDGSLDTSFNPGTGVMTSFGAVRALVLQSNGKILIGGDFFGYNGVSRRAIARINSDGSLDTSFDPGTGPTSLLGQCAPAECVVHDLEVQSDGKIVIAGHFDHYDGSPRTALARINSDGSLDPSFNAGIRDFLAGAYTVINALAVQPNGKIVIVGSFFQIDNGKTRTGITRLNSDGSFDETSFDPGTAVSCAPTAVTLQDDGRIVIVGCFSSYNGIPRSEIARVNNNGSLDITFDPGTGVTGVAGHSYAPNAVVIQGDGKILITGQFNGYNETPRNGIARILAGP